MRSLPRLLQTVTLVTVFAVVLGACGAATTPTATAPPAASPTPAAAQTPSPTPAITASPSGAAPEQGLSSGYPPDKVKELLAQNMHLPGMSYGAGETPQYGGTATYSNKAALPSDDIAEGSITRVNVIGSIAGDGDLVKNKREANGEFSPHLAESWTVSDDAKTWTFKLRPGVKWHDGTPLTAEDVKFEIEIQVKPPPGRRTLAMFNRLPFLKEVQAVDAATVRFIFTEPSPYLLETMVDSASFMHPRHLFKPQMDKGNVLVTPSEVGWVALGPFKYGEFVRGSSFRAVRYDQYWEKDAAGRQMPYLDAVYFFFIPDRVVAVGAFRSGRLDSTPRGVGSSLSPDMVVSVLKTFGNKGAWFHRYPYNEYGIHMNSNKPPFNDLRVRKAVTLYMDREEGALKMQGGFAFSTGFLSPASPYHSGAWKTWPGFMKETKVQDQAEGKRLLKETGFAGTDVGILCRTDYLYMCEFAESVLRGVGFNPRIDLKDVNAQSELSRTGQWQTQTSGPGAIVFPSDQLKGYTTYAANAGVSGPFDPKIDEFQKVILTSMDPKVRREALWAAERYYLVEMVYNAPFWREETVQAYRTYLKGSIVPGFQPHNNYDRATDWIDKGLR